MIRKEDLDFLKRHYKKYYTGEENGRKLTSVVYYEKMLLVEIYEMLSRIMGTGICGMNGSDCGDNATNDRNDNSDNT